MRQLVGGLNDLAAQLRANENERAAREQAERDAERRQQQVDEEERERRDAELLARLTALMTNRFQAALAMTPPPDCSVCSDGALQSVAFCARKCVSEATKPAPPPAPLPALEQRGGCTDPDDIYVEYTESATTPYQAPAQSSSGMITSCPAAGRMQMHWCVPAATWEAHKRTYGQPPGRQECYVWESVKRATRRAKQERVGPPRDPVTDGGAREVCFTADCCEDANRRGADVDGCASEKR